MKINIMKLKLTALLLVLYSGLTAQNKIVLTAPRLDTSSLSNRINLKANTNLNNVNGVLSSTYGGAGSVSGILKANGSGVVSAAVAGTDYVVPSALSGYLPLSGGTLSGNLTLNGGDFQINSQRYIYLGNSGNTLFPYIRNTGGDGIGIYNNAGSALLTANTSTGISTNSRDFAAAAISGTTATFSGTVSTGGDFYLSRIDQEIGYITRPNSVGYKKIQFSVNGGTNLDEIIFGANNSYFGGTVALAGALSGTSLSMSGAATIGTTSGNLGIGIAASAWGSSFRAITLLGSGNIASTTGGATSMQITNGSYFDGTNWVNTYTGVGSARYEQSDASGGYHAWFTAPSGSVGGTTSFTERLRVNSTALTSTVPISGTSLSMSGGGSFGGNVGIGTASPIFRGDIVANQSGNYTTSSSQVSARIFNNPANIGSGVNSSALRFQVTPDEGSSNPIVEIGVVAEAYGTNAGAMFFKTRDGSGITERMRLTSSGNLLIKTTTDNGTDALQVAGSGLFTSTIKGTNGGLYLQNSAANSAVIGLIVEGTYPWMKYIDTESGQQSYGEYIDGGTFYAKTVPYADRNSAIASVGSNIYTLNLSTGAATFSSSVTAQSVITNGGNIAIKLIPTALSTYGSANYAQWFRADGSTNRAYIGYGSGNDQNFQIATTEAGGSVQVFSGNGVLALTLASNQAAIFSSSVTVQSTTNSTSGTTGALIVGGGIGAGGAIYATSFFETSDRNKKDIFSVTKQADGIDFIGFKWKKELNLDNRKHLGVIAQQVEKVIPDAVTTDEKGFKSVNYTEVLIYKLEKLTEKVSELEKELKKLKTNSKKLNLEN